MPRLKRNKMHGEGIRIPDPLDPDTWNQKDAYPPHGHKYGARKAHVHGITFPSKSEARRYLELDLMMREGTIANLDSSAAYQGPGSKKRRIEAGLEFPFTINGITIATYIADFVYDTPDGARIVEDVKGARTDVYGLKKKMMRAFHGIDIYEVYPSQITDFYVQEVP